MTEVFEKAFAKLDEITEQRAAWDAERQAETFDEKYRREAAEVDAFLECRRLEQEEPEKFFPSRKN